MYEKHLEWLRPLDKLNRATVGFESALQYLKTDNTHLLEKFWQKTNQLDGIRNENVLDIIPELGALKVKLPHETFCVLPWVSLETSPIGTVRPCCLAEDEITDNTGENKYSLLTTDLEKIHNSQYMQNLRKEF